jgi:hypothetical protein
VKHLDESWQQWQRQIVRAGGGAAQIQAMRDAFFAGAMTLLEHLTAGVKGTPEHPEVTEADIELLDDVEAELELWRAEVEARTRVKQ